MSRARRPGVLRSLIRLGAAAALGAAGRERIREADARARSIIASRRTELGDRTLPVLTDLGSMYAAAGAAAALAIGGRRKLARDTIAVAALAWGVAQAGKKVFGGERPYEAGEAELLVRPPAGDSYPSGHPAVAAAMVSVLAPELRPALGAQLERLPRFVGFTRVYVGAHYPTDVIGGLLIGRAVGDLWRRFAR